LKGQFISFCKAGLAIISSRNHRILSRNVRKSKFIIEENSDLMPMEVIRFLVGRME